MSNRWSAPAFVKVTGVEFGLVGGIDRVSLLRCMLFSLWIEALHLLLVRAAGPT